MHPGTAGAGGLTVAVTGPTGAIGKALMRALENEPAIERVIGMARRPFDPVEAGWTKAEYRQGDILDMSAVRSLVEGVDVVIHLAFLIFGSPDETQSVNLEGSRNVFEASFDAGIKSLIYTSSVAAYGFHEDNPDVLHEDIPARGSEEHYYSAQKAELEKVLFEMAAGQKTDVFVFRPCIVAGPEATELIENIPYVQLSERIPTPLRSLVGTIPLLRPVIPDPGTPFQLVHEDDVASALISATTGGRVPGVYNLAAEGEITLTDLAHALGWYSIPIPELAVDVTAKVISRLPLLPSRVSWISALSTPVLMDTSKARMNLGWAPEHDALDTLALTIQGARDKGLISRSP
jgi:nucleoside-diphosphate-sugar epimerase